MKPARLLTLLLVMPLLSACDKAVLDSWNSVFGDEKDKKAQPAHQPAHAPPARTTTSAPSTPAVLPPVAIDLSTVPVAAPAAVTAQTSPAAPMTTETQPFEFAEAKDGSTRNSAFCRFADLTLPANAKVYAAGAYGGRPLGYQIDQSGHAATRIDVAVNHRADPVVLMLGAYEPTVWNVGWSKGTQIAAVLVSGYHRQAISGLPASVPVLVSTYDNKGPCGYFYVKAEDVSNLNPVAQRAWGRRVDRVYPAANGQVVIGDTLFAGTALVTAKGASADAFRDANAPLAGPSGIEDAVRKGLLREATSADLQAWKSASAAADLPPVEGASVSSSSSSMRLYNAYVVLKPFTLPAGLYGAHSVTLFVPKGVARPSGELGHSHLYDFNTLTCAGATCGMD